MSRIKIIPYPQVNPEVPGSTSRFDKLVKVQENGLELEKVLPRLAQPEVADYEFKYDKETATGGFFATSKKGKSRIRPLSPYIPSVDLIELVRLTQILQRPVIVKGEPGSGKTQLARSVAYEWYGAEYKNHFFEWSVKSTSKAADGLYTYDHVGRLRNAQQLKGSDSATSEQSEDLLKYREFGPMARAFLTSTAESPSILLIDEIDKADIDFPNDLLLELDERRFTIPETGEFIEAKYPPLIFITSNDERELPEAFLRRCLFLYIKFPDGEQLKNIIKAQIPGFIESNADFVKRAVERFNLLREEIKNDPSDSKRVSTSELLDYLRAYEHDLSTGKIISTEEDLKNLPLYHQALIKTLAGLTRREKDLQAQSAAN